MSALDRVRQAVEHATGHPAHNGAARCPAHPDSNPSLSINEGRDGRVVLHCHAGCTVGDIVAAVGLTEADLFEPDAWETTQKRRIVETYDYLNASGDLTYQVVRFDPKDFRQRRPDGHDGWIWNMAGVERVLYRLPEVLDAIARDETICIVEGEKDVHALKRAGYVATTNPGGAGKWDPGYVDYLDGATVAIIADNDKAGIAHARQINAQVAEHPRIATMGVYVPAEGHKDIAQHLGAGLGLDDLQPLTEDTEAPEDDPEALERAETANIFLSGLVAGEDILELPEPEPMVGTWLDRGMLAQLVGAYGSGKTFVALELALSVASGKSWFGQQIHHQGQVLYIAAEGGYTMPDRVRGWAEASGRQIPEDLLLYPYRFDITDNGSTMGGLWRPLRVVIEDGAISPSLIVLDTRSRLTVGDENSSETASRLLAAIDQIRELIPEVSIMVIHHPGHSVTGRGRGHSSFEDNLDVVWSIEGRLRDGPVQLIDQKQKARAQNEQPFWLKLETIDESYPRLVLTSEPDDDGDGPMLRTDITNKIALHPGLTMKDLWRSGSPFKVAGRTRVETAVIHMVNTGELVCQYVQGPNGERSADRLFLPGNTVSP